MRIGPSLLAAFLLFAAPALAGAQEAADSARPPADFASPFLPPDHWSRAALRKLEGLGLAPAGYSWGAHAVTQRAAAILFEYASVHASARLPAAKPLADAYRARFAEEFEAVTFAISDLRPRGLVLSGAYAEGAAGFERGRARGGIGFPGTSEFSGPTPIDDRSGLRVEAASPTMFLPYIAFNIATAHLDGEDTHSEVYGTVAWRGVGVWGGRRQIGFGPGTSGLVLNAGVPLDGGGLYLTDPVLLPSFLRALGPVQFETVLAKLERNGTIGNPYFWSARGTLSPHERVSLGLTRGVMFGGTGTTDVSLRNLIYVFIGKHGGTGSEFDNHVISLDARYRPPLGTLPLQIYVEWGFEDSAGAYKDVPGVVAGAEVVAFAGLPELSVGVERASFAPMCCGNPVWYRHWLFTDGWTVNGTLLGHPLGGHGREWLAYAGADLLDAKLQLKLRAFHRDRESENLFAPDRVGSSIGGAVGAELRTSRALDLVVNAAIEDGERNWRQSRASAGVRFRF